MAAFAQYTYIFVVGTIFAFLDAWNIGANDVGNSWATSVGSRSVTYMQAMLLGAVAEFTGAVGAGGRVTDTIRTKLVDPQLYKAQPGVLMLGMLCAVLASSVFLTFATKLGFPVSTTHSILGGVVGMGIATVGSQHVTWTNKKDGKFNIDGGVVAVFIGWFLAPALAGAFAATTFLITKYGVLKSKNPVKMSILTIPLYFGVTAALLCMLVISKGGRINNRLTDGGTAGVIVGTGVGFALLVAIFLLPWLYRKVVLDDWRIRWYHVFLGPLVLRRGKVPEMPEGHINIPNFYEGHYTEEELEARRKAVEEGEDPDTVVKSRGYFVHKPLVGPKPEGKPYSIPVMFWYVKWALLHGVDRDVVRSQTTATALTGDIEKTHAVAEHYDIKVEYVFGFLQVMTAFTMSFTHGANDVANAIGPYTTIFQIWDSGEISSKKFPVPDWILCFGGGAIIIGLWTYGYNIMKNLGNRLTLHSPSRGFSMELGSALSVIVATKQALPVSTTQCICGATVAVGLCNGTWRAINWRMVLWIYLGWLITVPMAGILSGSLMAFIINAPRYKSM